MKKKLDSREQTAKSFFKEEQCTLPTTPSKIEGLKLRDSGATDPLNH